MTGPPRLILASASPRRAELLARLGLEAEVFPARVDETYLPGEDPAAHAERLAREKAEVVARSAPDALVIGGDTVVVVDGHRVLGKPGTPEAAVAMLLALAGREHEVLSAVALAGGGGTVSAVGRARVRFRAFGPEVARSYVATGEPMDKAGAYGIQGLGAALVDSIHGDYYTVVGLPITRFLELLELKGWRYVFGRLERCQ
ncbi:MAG: nucleoside triphosphate pyrophosphatase [Longimicrobiales bacterium]|nr:nucleoside triphosphate pyrophosphatase [Longimicrobiales bacterium]